MTASTDSYGFDLAAPEGPRLNNTFRVSLVPFSLGVHRGDIGDSHVLSLYNLDLQAIKVSTFAIASILVLGMIAVLSLVFARDGWWTWECPDKQPQHHGISICELDPHVQAATQEGCLSGSKFYLFGSTLSAITKRK